MIVERRVRRSTALGPALEHQLEASAERAGFEFMLLASAEGLLIASSPGEAEASEAVAARLAVLDLDAESFGEVWREERTISARAFFVRGQRLILAAAGKIDHREMQHAMNGVTRILAN